MKDTLKVIGLGLLIVVGLVLLLYAVAQVGEPDQKEIELLISSNGPVFYLPYAGDFGKHLNEFIAEHPDLRVVSIAPLDTLGNGATRGYWVVTEKKQDRNK